MPAERHSSDRDSNSCYYCQPYSVGGSSDVAFRYKSFSDAVLPLYDADDCDLHARHVGRLLVWYLAAGALLIAVCVAFFCFFLRLYHLGWTVLTNNFCLITILVLCNLYSTLVDTTAARIREDQFKVCGIRYSDTTTKGQQNKDRPGDGETICPRRWHSSTVAKIEADLRPSADGSAGCTSGGDG